MWRQENLQSRIFSARQKIAQGLDPAVADVLADCSRGLDWWQ